MINTNATLNYLTYNYSYVLSQLHARKIVSKHDLADRYCMDLEFALNDDESDKARDNAVKAKGLMALRYLLYLQKTTRKWFYLHEKPTTLIKTSDLKAIEKKLNLFVYILE